MRNSKLKTKTVIALVFDTWYGTVALCLLFELVMKLIKELLFRAPLPLDSVLSIAHAIHYVQLGLPLVILVSVVVSFVRGKRLRAAGQFFMAILAVVLYVVVTVVTTKSETVCVDISTGRSWTESSSRTETKKEQLRKERIDRMRKAAQNLNKPLKIEPKHPEINGNCRAVNKTLSDAEIRKLLNAGYKPDASSQLTTSDVQLGYSLVKKACDSKWDQPPWSDTLKPMTIRVWLGEGGRVVRYQLESSSGDERADQSVKTAVSRIGCVSGLPTAFIDKYKSSGVPIRFTVRPK